MYLNLERRNAGKPERRNAGMPECSSPEQRNTLTRNTGILNLERRNTGMLQR